MRKDSIRFLFYTGMSYKEISLFLRTYVISISLRHLKRLINKLGLYRRKNYSDIVEVVEFIHKELQASGQLHGYRWLHHRCRQSGLIVQKEVVRSLLQILDPNGVELRRRRRLKRREYASRGPNYIWHIDSYDKLKPFGICINGCIDGFSRHIIWLEAGKTNNDPHVIGGYFCKAISETGGVPCILRGDMGTENSLVAEIQSTKGRFIYGTSQHNQRIESWWGILRKQNIQFWMSLFEDIKSDGLFSGDNLDKNLIQFCFLPLLKEELADLVMEWNTHSIRTGWGGGGGRPITLYNLPNLFNTNDFLLELNAEEVELCFEITDLIRDSPPCDEDVFDLGTTLMDELNIQEPTNCFQAVDLYCTLRQLIRDN